jgi:hypothetical protein
MLYLPVMRACVPRIINYSVLTAHSMCYTQHSSRVSGQLTCECMIVYALTHSIYYLLSRVSVSVIIQAMCTCAPNNKIQCSQPTARAINSTAHNVSAMCVYVIVYAICL